MGSPLEVVAVHLTYLIVTEQKMVTKKTDVRVTGRPRDGYLPHSTEALQLRQTSQKSYLEPHAFNHSYKYNEKEGKKAFLWPNLGNKGAREGATGHMHQ